MKNIGPKSWAMFSKAGIHDVEIIQNMGTVAACVAVVQAGRKPLLNQLMLLHLGYRTGTYLICQCGRRVSCGVNLRTVGDQFC